MQLYGISGKNGSWLTGSLSPKVVNSEVCAGVLILYGGPGDFVIELAMEGWYVTQIAVQ